MISTTGRAASPVSSSSAFFVLLGPAPSPIASADPWRAKGRRGKPGGDDDGPAIRYRFRQRATLSGPAMTNSAEPQEVKPAFGLCRVAVLLTGSAAFRATRATAQQRQ